MKKSLLLLLLTLFGKITFSQIQVVNFSTGYSAPVDIKNCGDDRLFIVEQAGIISICDTDGVKRPVPFLDIQARVRCCGEQGLLGLAFPKDFLTTGYFYVNYTNNNDDTRISRFRVSATNPDSADSLSEEILLTIYQPYSNHNGGHITFGADDYLYVGMGDGGSGGDPGHRAQNPDSLLGKILRLDVDPTVFPYNIPEDNIFANDTTLGRPEIYSLGWRNPWRFSFDRLTGDMWVADVGQNQVEEIDFEPEGTASGWNYGWKCWEGTNQYSTASGCQPLNAYTSPVHQFNHSPGGYCSVTGGYRYRGTKFQQLYGKYFYADYCNSQIQYVFDSTGVFLNTNLGSIGANSVTTFGEDRHGEIYLSSGGNKIMKIISADCSPVSAINYDVDTVSDCGAGAVLLSIPVDTSYTYDWSYNATSVGATSTYVATSPGVYYLTVDNQGCTSTDSITVIFSTPLPVTFTGLDTLYCDYANPVILSPSTAGGTFSGTGVSSQIFSPSVAGIGTHDVIYALTGSFGCVSTDTQTVRVDACLGVPDLNWTKSISVHPNPTNGSIKIETISSLEKKANIFVRDIAGRILYNETFIFNRGENTIPIELNLPAGIYLLEVANGNSSSKLKLVIQ